MENAISMIEYKVKVLKSEYNLELASDKIRFLKEVAKLISEVDSKIEREIYVDKISKQYGISKEAIFGEINKLLYKSKKDTNKLLDKPLPNKKEKELPEISKVEIEREKMILYFLIKNYEEVGEKIISNVDVEDFKVERYKMIYTKILELKDKATNMYGELSNIENEGFQSTLGEILFSEYEINSVDKFIEDIINNYEKNKLNFRKNEILELLSDKTIEKDRMVSLEKELNKIIIELAKIN